MAANREIMITLTLSVEPEWLEVICESVHLDSLFPLLTIITAFCFLTFIALLLVHLLHSFFLLMRKPAISRAYRVAWRCTMMTMNCNRGCISFYSHMIYRKGRLVTFGVYILWWQNIREVSLQGSNKNAVICRTQWSESRIFHCHITVIFSCCSVVVVCTPMTRT